MNKAKKELKFNLDKNIKVIGGYIYIRKYYRGKAIQFSTNYPNEPQWMEYVRKNIHTLFIKKWNESSPDSCKIDVEREANEHFLDSFQYFLDDKKRELDKGNIKPSTFAKDKAFLEQLKGDVNIKHKRTFKIDIEFLELYASILHQKKRCKATIKYHVYKILAIVQSYRLYFKLPLLDSKLLDISRYGCEPKEKDTFSEDEIKQILDEAKSDEYSKELEAILQIAANTGARPGEILAIKKKDIDLVNDTINIQKTRNEKGEEYDPKTASSKRIIPIFNTNFKEFLQTNYYRFKERIFAVGVTRTKLNKEYKRLLKKLGLKYRRMYDLRHSTDRKSVV